MAEVTLKIDGMTCAHCERAVAAAIGRVAGARPVVVSSATGEARIEVAAGVDLGAIGAAIGAEGYTVVTGAGRGGECAVPEPPAGGAGPATVPAPAAVSADRTAEMAKPGGEAVRSPPATTAEVAFAIAGMSCVNCARAIERSVGRLPGVAEARVNFAVEEGRVRFDPSQLSQDAIFQAVRDAGYTPAPEGGSSYARERRERALFFFAASLAVAALLTPHLGLGGRGELALLLLLATVNQVGPGLDYYRGALHALRAGVPNMDVLIALGIAASYSFSLLLFAGVTDHHALATAIYLVAFIRLGKLMEQRARGRASRALTALASLQVERARRATGDGWQEVALAEVEPGDRVQVRPGERIPIDGVVVAGESAVDESLATGEALPVQRGVGDAVIGSTLNQSGVIEVEVTRTGADAFLGQVIAMVRAAQATPAPIQRLADRVSALFVPGVVAVAGVALGGWLIAGAGLTVAVTHAVAVLVVACPCALGLATPTAIVVASGMALGRGLLIKSGAALEALARVDRVVFDKTGTLTSGQPEVVAVAAAAGVTEAEVVALAAAVEWASSHPFAQAIRAEAMRRDLTPATATAVEERAGRGVVGEVAGARVVAGSEALLAAEGVAAVAGDGHHGRVGVAKAGRLVGWLHLADRPRPETARVLAALRDLGVATELLSGDRPQAVAALVRELGIAAGEGGLLPADKVARVRARVAAGERVCFVGDGVNDAPVLAAATVGIAMGAGAEVAREAGDLVIVHSDLSGVVEAIQLGRATLRKIKQNLFWAFCYNTVAIPVAAGLFVPYFHLTLPPEWAGLAMALSSVSVVSNSLLLRLRG